MEFYLTPNSSVQLSSPVTSLANNAAVTKSQASFTYTVLVDDEAHSDMADQASQSLEVASMELDANSFIVDNHGNPIWVLDGVNQTPALPDDDLQSNHNIEVDGKAPFDFTVGTITTE